MKKLIFAFYVSVICVYSFSVNAQWQFSIELPGVPNVFCANDSTAYSVNWPHGIFKTTNAGTNWYHQAGMTSPNANNCFFISELTGWVVGVNGSLWRTTDGGDNWLDRSFGSTFRYSIFFPTPDTGWAVGIPGIITKTTNGGDNWFEQTNPATFYLNDVHFVNALTGWAVGFVPFQTIILKTTNGGDLWFEQNSGRTSSAQSVFFLNESTGWIVGTSNLYLKTTNGGEFWSSRNDVGQNNMSVHFIDENTGWIAGETGTFIKSTDSGISWISENITGNYCVSVHFSGPEFGLMGSYYNPSSFFVANIYRFYNDIPLPIELNSFTSLVNGRDVLINWSTSAELNNSGFEIERANDNAEWHKIGSVSGSGTTNELRSYFFKDRDVETGSYKYRLKQFDFNGNFGYYECADVVNIGIPDKYDLSQNYPNPFNPVTTINYDLPIDNIVTIKVFDITGKEISTLANEMKTAGYYSIKFNATDFVSGTYFYTMTSGEFTSVKKFVVIK